MQVVVQVRETLRRGAGELLGDPKRLWCFTKC